MKPVVGLVESPSPDMDSHAANIQPDAPIPTWFGIGGGADRLARPSGVAGLRACLGEDPDLLVLGDGANLLVDDDGVGNLVVALTSRAFSGWTFNKAAARVVAGAGANLPRLIVESVRLGLAGLEGLGGIPATVGGAAIMNAGGAFGQIADAIAAVRGLRRDGSEVRLERDEIDFRYRHSGLNGLILTEVEFQLAEEDPVVLRARLKEVMDYKKRSQPMGERSAGCVWKNPTLPHELRDIGPAGERVSAGLLIDRAGCKGLRVGGAGISTRHANFVVTELGARAGDVIRLMDQTRQRVEDCFGVRLEPEVVIWSRRSAPEGRERSR